MKSWEILMKFSVKFSEILENNWWSFRENLVKSWEQFCEILWEKFGQILKNIVLWNLENIGEIRWKKIIEI